LAGVLQKNVTVEDVDASMLDLVDAANRTKYGRRYPDIVKSITDRDHRSTTLRLAPRGGR
jgi:hypothetical protein